MEYQSSTCTAGCPEERIEAVREMAMNREGITLSGLSFAPWNKDYKIRKFGWKRVSKTPSTWEWILELEEDDITEEC